MDATAVSLPYDFDSITLNRNILKRRLPFIFSSAARYWDSTKKNTLTWRTACSTASHVSDPARVRTCAPSTSACSLSRLYVLRCHPCHRAWPAHLPRYSFSSVAHSPANCSRFLTSLPSACLSLLFPPFLPISFSLPDL